MGRAGRVRPPIEDRDTKVGSVEPGELWEWGVRYTEVLRGPRPPHRLLPSGSGSMEERSVSVVQLPGHVLGGVVLDPR